jgi:DNA-binding NarL/FixJ family response regulator
VVSAHPLLVDALSELFARTSDLRVTDVASDVEQAVSLWQQHEHDLIVTSIRLLGRRGDGLGLLAKVRLLNPQVRVLILGDDPDPRVAHDALSRGAVGYMRTTTTSTEVLSCVRDALSGRTACDRETSSALMGTMFGRFPHQRSPLLTPRESEILKLMTTLDSTSDRSLGTALHLSPQTVKSHVSSILNKLQVSDRGAAVGRAMRDALV